MKPTNTYKTITECVYYENMFIILAKIASGYNWSLNFHTIIWQ